MENSGAILSKWKMLADANGLTVDSIAATAKRPKALVKRALSGKATPTTGEIADLAVGVGCTVNFHIREFEAVAGQGDTPLAKLGAGIRVARAAKRLGRAELAALADVADNTIFNIESGKSARWNRVTQVCEALGVTPVCRFE